MRHLLPVLSHPLPPSRRSRRTTPFWTAPRAMTAGTSTTDLCHAVSLAPPILILSAAVFLTRRAQLDPSRAIMDPSRLSPILPR